MVERREYGEGSVHKAHDKDCPRPVNGKGEATCACKWRGVLDAGFTERGTRRRITVVGRTEAEARRRLKNRKGEIARAETASTKVDARRKTLASWCDDWLALREHDVRPATWIAYRTMVNRYIKPTIGTVRLAELAPDHARRVDAAARKTGAPTSLKARRVLGKMLRDAIREGYAVPTAILDAAAPPKGQRTHKAKREALSTAQAVAALSHAADVEGGVRWYVSLFQGMRQGEVLGLTREAVDFERGLIDVSWQLQPLPYKVKRDRTSGFRVPDDFEARHLVGRFHLVRPKTERSERPIPMVPTVAKALRVWLEKTPPNPYDLVWVRPNGWPIDKAGDADQWRVLQQAAGVKHPNGRAYFGHEMRNTTATLLAETGTDEAIIIAILGHSSIATSRLYVEAREPAMRAALEAVERAFTQVPARVAQELPAGDGTRPSLPEESPG